MNRTNIRHLLFIAILFISLFPAYAQGQDGEDASFKKFGVGIGYGYRSFMMTEDPDIHRILLNLHPVEYSFQYRPDQKHTFYATIPWMYRGFDRWVKTDEYYNEYRNESWKACTYGLDAGYDYTIISYKKLFFFAGIGIGFQRYKNKTIWDTSEEELFPPQNRSITTYITVTDAFSILPQAGIRYEWKRIGLELKYRFHITKKKSVYDFTDIYPLCEGCFDTHQYNNNNHVYKHGISGSVFYYL